jgi:hypothetical protein
MTSCDILAFDLGFFSLLNFSKFYFFQFFRGLNLMCADNSVGDTVLSSFFLNDVFLNDHNLQQSF